MLACVHANEPGRVWVQAVSATSFGDESRPLALRGSAGLATGSAIQDEVSSVVAPHTSTPCLLARLPTCFQLVLRSPNACENSRRRGAPRVLARTFSVPTGAGMSSCHLQTGGQRNAGGKPSELDRYTARLRRSARCLTTVRFPFPTSSPRLSPKLSNGRSKTVFRHFTGADRRSRWRTHPRSARSGEGAGSHRRPSRKNPPEEFAPRTPPVSPNDPGDHSCPFGKTASEL